MHSSKVPFGSTSASLEFFHSLSLRVLSKTQLQKACSRLMRVLSHSNTHYLNRHMVGCGCHEILIPRSFYVRFLTRFCHFRSPSSSLSLLAAVLQIEEFLTKWRSVSKIEVNHPSFNNLAVSSHHLRRLFAVLSIHLFISVSGFHSFTMHAVSLSICPPQTQIQKAFSLHVGALSL